jgi:hypothetical protein
LLEPLHVYVLETLVLCKLTPVKVFVTHLALHWNFRAFSLDMLENLGTSHVLKVFVVTDIASKLWTVEHRMFLQLSHRLPDYFPVLWVFEASVRKLAKVETVPQHLVHFLQEISSLLAVGTANFKNLPLFMLFMFALIRICI